MKKNEKAPKNVQLAKSAGKHVASGKKTVKSAGRQ